MRRALFSDVAAEYVGTLHLKPRSEKRYRTLPAVLYPCIGNPLVHEITPEMVDQFKAWSREMVSVTKRSGEVVKKRRYADKTVDMTVAFLKAALRYAYMKKYMRKEITDDIKGIPKSKIQQKPVRGFTDEELRIVFSENINDNLKLCFRGLLYLGCRLGELQAINWEHVDLKARTVRLKGEKTNKWRTVPISAGLYPFLVKAREQCDKRAAHVFSMENGGRANDHLYDVLMKICRKHDIHDVTTHSFRHSFIQCHLKAGTDFRTIMAWSGHSDIRTFMVYLAQYQPTPEHINNVKYPFLETPDGTTL